MTQGPSLEDIYAVMSAVSFGQATERVPIPKNPAPDDVPTRFAIALNVLLDDLTLRTRALRRSEQELAATLDSIADGVITTDTSGRITRMNPVAERLTGWTATSAHRRRLAEVLVLVDEETGGVEESPVDQVLREGAIARAGHVMALVSLDGSRRAVASSGAPIRDADGNVRGVVLVFHDQTEARKAERRLRLAAIVESSGDAIIGKTLDGVITSWNEGAHRIFGYTSDEAVGKPISILIPPDRQHEEVEILRTLGRGERVEQFETVRTRKDGSEIHVSLTSSPVHDFGGTLIGASKIVRDITERKRSEEALALAKRQAEAASRELEAFSYSVAHDLRAPLRGMNGFAQLLLTVHETRLDEQGQDWLREIALNANKMGELIDGLLSLARTSRSELKREQVDVSAVFREVAAQIAASDTSRSVEVCVQESLRAAADSRLIRALAENLVGNAWKFTSKVAAGRIDVGALEKDGTSTFFVRDNGAGFDMTFAGKMFSPFQRLHTTAEFPGTGIGLATVQRIVHRHGGRIWAEASVDAGATFYFTLPTGPLEAT